MRNHAMPFFALGALLVTLAGCDEVRMPVAPSTPPPPPAPAPPALLPYVDEGFPAAPAGAAVYGRVTASTFAGRHRYVLLPDGNFGLQYLGLDGRFFEYAGTYTRTGSGFRLVFDANGGAWEAAAMLEGDLLIVKYNLDMVLSDFEDGIYARVR